MIQLIDRNKKMCQKWEQSFGEEVNILNDDILSIPTDCIISPANSFGFMDGGLDLLISHTLGWQVEKIVRDTIEKDYYGEILVGQAFLSKTDSKLIPFIICSPTMRVPQILPVDSVNIYLASKAIFRIIKTHPHLTYSVSGLGTGIGGSSFKTCAKQMKYAYEEIFSNSFIPKDINEAFKQSDKLI